jgi:2-oxoglutarate dehydrogenase E2 component (dihydrolipoamide succinyltransferase)
MILEVKVPQMGESISSATISKIAFKEGDFVEKDATLVELETEKVNLVVSAPESGVISKILIKEGDEVEVDQLICNIEPGEKKESNSMSSKEEVKVQEVIQQKSDSIKVSPAAQNIINNKDLDVKNIEGSGRNGLITKPDVMSSSVKKSENGNNQSQISSQSLVNNFGEESQTVKMSALRRTVARRLKEAQNTAAILTTFNEVDMLPVMEMRKKYQEDFVKKYDVKLGFMSIFTKAASLALKELPAVNAQIEGDNIIYKNYCHIGVAIGSEKGLVVPVIRHCDKLSFADIEKEIINYAKKAKNGTLAPNDFMGGTFTISNGGVYGSMLSTPIINPPQSAILGMHSIVERPVVVNGSIVIRPIMYIALSYDHRIIDGKEAVTFLVKIKNYIENPEKMLLGC